MTAKLRSIQRVLGARKRVRDASAGRALAADQRRAEAEEVREQAHQALAEVLSSAPDRLRDAHDARALLRLEMERISARGAITSAEQSCVRAAAESRRAQDELRARECELRRTEKVMDRAQAALVKREERAEQQLCDELGGATGRRLT